MVGRLQAQGKALAKYCVVEMVKTIKILRNFFMRFWLIKGRYSGALVRRFAAG